MRQPNPHAHRQTLQHSAPQSHYDVAYDAFRTFCTQANEYCKDHYSEADTRVKFVDRILIDVLGWTELQITREESYRDDDQRRCIDYLLSTSTPTLVVEAKKILHTFEIPSDSGDITYSLNGVVKTWPNAWSAITQARQYSDNAGARYALITNGKQFIAFRTISDSLPWKKAKFLAFPTLDAVDRHFCLFYECLSATTILRDTLTKIALSTPELPPRVRPRQILPQLAGG